MTTRTYEGMFLVDNDAVRAGWKQAKAVVTGLIEKNGGEVHATRRWDERRLAYPVRNRRRATYLLAFYSIEPGDAPGLVRDLDINETVLRHLVTRVEAVPAGEVELSRAEEASDFVVPEPPADDVIEVAEPAGEEGEEASAKSSEDREKKEGGEEKKREGESRAAGEAKAEGKEGDALVGASQKTEQGEKE